MRPFNNSIIPITSDTDAELVENTEMVIAVCQHRPFPFQPSQGLS